MTFKERYDSENTWHGKVTVMEIYHLAMCQRIPGWTITKTSEYFSCSIGLVSENLRLAQAIHTDESILKAENRQEALKKFNNRR